MKPTDLAMRLTAFLGSYLPTQRDLSPNTIKAYRDAFTLLLRYCRDHRGLAAERLTLTDLDVPCILGFLDHLTSERRCSDRTRNHRLAAIHAFFRYVQTEEPDKIAHCQKVLAIPQRRCGHAAVSYLSPNEVAAILAAPDRATVRGRRDTALLSLLYDTGARVQEIADLRVSDVRLATPPHVRLTGKGRKTRVVPILSGTNALLTAYLDEHRLTRVERLDGPLFFNRRGEHLTRFGVGYILRKHTETARHGGVAITASVSPHTFRHTKAMHLLQAGNPAIIIRDILGHADIKTTGVYARADVEAKRRALEKAEGMVTPAPPPSWQSDANLMEWLANL